MAFKNGVSQALVATVVACQVLPTVEVAVMGNVVRVSARSIGALAGTRVVGRLGRIPIETTMNKVHLICERLDLDEQLMLVLSLLLLDFLLVFLLSIPLLYWILLLSFLSSCSSFSES